MRSISKLQQTAKREILKSNPSISTGDFAKAFNKKMKHYKFILENMWYNDALTLKPLAGLRSLRVRK